jgi:hypothetical protein
MLPVVWQLWIPPFTGLADNGDFAKVAGRFALTPASPSEQDTFLFWIREWKVDEARRWVSQYWGAEVWLARAALVFERGGRFDMRWMGLVHAAIFAVFAWWMAGAIGNRRWAGIAAVLAFTDAAYVTYFQSFYFDAAAILGFLLMFAAWLCGAPVGMAAGGTLLALSKGPHAPAAMLIAVLWLLSREKRWMLAAMPVLAAGVFMLSRTTPEYQATAYYNLAFYKLGPRDAAALDALRVRPEDRKLLGTHAFEPASPAQSEAWLRAFYPAGGYRNAITYYLGAPKVALSVLWDDLRNEAKQIRAENLGNYERSTGKRYCTVSESFGWWSGAKRWLLERAPWHVFILWPGLAWMIWRHGRWRWLLAGILLTGMYTFAVASLADALETYRHLLLFHVAYDALAVLALLTDSS